MIRDPQKILLIDPSRGSSHNRHGQRWNVETPRTKWRNTSRQNYWEKSELPPLTLSRNHTRNVYRVTIGKYREREQVLAISCTEGGCASLAMHYSWPKSANLKGSTAMLTYSSSAKACTKIFLGISHKFSVPVPLSLASSSEPMKQHMVFGRTNPLPC